MSGSAALLAWPQLAPGGDIRARLAQILDFFGRIVSAMFMRVNSRCAHHTRPPPRRMKWRRSRRGRLLIMRTTHQRWAHGLCGVNAGRGRRDAGGSVVSYGSSARFQIRGRATIWIWSSWGRRRMSGHTLSKRAPSTTRTSLNEIVSPLGAGGMGEVYRARDARLRRDVALKILPAEVSADPSRRARFEQEAHAAAALNHPNILSVYDVGGTDDALVHRV